MKLRYAILAALALALPACDREDPTTIGAGLVENGSVRTFEVTLEPADYLVRDTSFLSFRPPVASFFVLANAYQNVLNAHGLAKFAVDPIILVLNASNQTVVDSTPKLQRGFVVVHIDSVASSSEGPVQLRLYRAAEQWDSTATWTDRQNAGTLARTRWTTPGGTRGALLDTATYTGGDSVVFRIDTLTLKEWRDTPASSTGTLLTVETPHARLVTGFPTLRTEMKTSVGDTTVTIFSTPFLARFITDPVPPAASTDPRVGGFPTAYRSIFEVKENLKNITVPCPFSATCRVKLSDATIAAADLMLQPSASPPGFVPERPMTILAYTLLPTAQVPLVRSPLGGQTGFLAVGPSSFQINDAIATPLGVTGFIRDLVAPLDSTTFNSRYLVLLQGVPATFGYASFRGQPKLRLRLSVAQEIQLP